jgi:hypothetical protein
VRCRHPLTFPPSPPSSPTLRERKGGRARPHLPPQPPFLSHAAGEEGGRVRPHLPPLAHPSSPTLRERKGGGERSSGAPASLTIPSSRTKSPLSRSAAAGPGGRSTPLPQRGRGVGGEGGPQRGSGAGGEGRPQRGSGAGGEEHPSPAARERGRG